MLGFSISGRRVGGEEASRPDFSKSLHKIDENSLLFQMFVINYLLFDFLRSLLSKSCLPVP